MGGLLAWARGGRTGDFGMGEDDGALILHGGGSYLLRDGADWRLRMHGGARLVAYVSRFNMPSETGKRDVVDGLLRGPFLADFDALLRDGSSQSELAEPLVHNCGAGLIVEKPF